MTVEDRVRHELQAEVRLVPTVKPGPVASPPPQWVRYAAAAAVLALVVGIGYILRIQTSAETLQEDGAAVEIVSVSGDTDPDVLAVWEAWWEAWVVVRADIGDGGLDPRPLQQLSEGHEAEMEALAIMHTVDTDGSDLGPGAESTVRLSPVIRVDGRHAQVRDCVLIDPVPWPTMRNPNSTAGYVVFEAEMELTDSRWVMIEFGAEPLVDQFGDGETCRP